MLVNNYIQLLTELPISGVSAVLRLRESGASIPFMARYRKEATGNLDEVEIESIINTADNYIEIEKRKKFILDNISKQGLLNRDLEEKLKD